MKAHFSYKLVGIVFMALSGVLSGMYFLFSQPFIRFIEMNFSSDQHLTSNGVRELVSTFFFGMVVMFGIGFVLYKAKDASWRQKMREVVLEEPLSRSSSFWPAPYATLIISTVVGLILILMMNIAYRVPSLYPILYKKDHGIVDLLVPITMAVSAVLLGSVVWRLNGQVKVRKYRAILLIGYFLMAALFIVYAGEETSWGQDFFRWQTPELFSGNLESQTNLHNYFNPYFVFGYIALSLVLIVVLLSAWLEFNQRWLLIKRFFLPHPSMIGLGLLIAFAAVVWFQEQELLEELMATFVLFYSVRVFSCSRCKELVVEA